MEQTQREHHEQQNQFQVLVDSDAFIGWLYPDDAHFQRANEVFEALMKQNVAIVTTSLVVAETATVLSYKEGQSLANQFLGVMRRGNIPIIHINELLQERALDIFGQQTKKGTSVTDYANVAVMQTLEIESIFSFDKVYREQFGMELTPELVPNGSEKGANDERKNIDEEG